MTATEKLVKDMRDAYLAGFPKEASGYYLSLSSTRAARVLAEDTPQNAARILEELPVFKAAQITKHLDEKLFREVFPKVRPEVGMPILNQLPESPREERMALLPQGSAKEYRELMSYPADSAGALMNKAVRAFYPRETVSDVLQYLRETKRKQLLDFYVTDENGYLVGSVGLQDVAVHPPRTPLDDIMRREPLMAAATDDRELVVDLLEKNRLTSLPVVDFEGKFLGMLVNRSLLGAAQAEASEDIQALFGAGRDEKALSKISLAVRKRLPWLEINLATAFLASAVVGLFEDTISKFTALAVFLPVVAGQSGNTGSQALAVTVRGLALKEIRLGHWVRMMWKEMGVGFINGVAVAATTSLCVYLWTRSPGFAAVIGIAMVISMVIAGVSGCLIPMLLKVFKQDPASSSSIILTTITDISGFMSFLGLATLFQRWLV